MFAKRSQNNHRRMISELANYSPILTIFCHQISSIREQFVTTLSPKIRRFICHQQSEEEEEEKEEEGSQITPFYQLATLPDKNPVPFQDVFIPLSVQCVC